MPDRSTASTLANLADRRQDIRYATVVRPNGASGEHVVVQDGSTVEIVVNASLGGGPTWSPGSRIQIATAGGEQRRVILGGPPTGGRGQSGYPARNLPATPAPGLIQYAFYQNLTDNVYNAWLYRDGKFISDRDVLSHSAILSPVCVLADPLLAAGSLAFMDGVAPALSLYVWDPDLPAVYHYAPASGTYMSAAGWWAGAFYWIEMPSESPHGGGDTVATLKSASGRLVSPSVVTTFNVPIPDSHYDFVTWAPESPSSTSMSMTAIECDFRWIDPGTEVSGLAAIRFQLAGSGDVLDPATGAGFGIPEPAGGSFRALNDGPDASIFRRDNAIGSAYAQFWPTSGAWSMQAYLNCSLSRSLATASTYGVPDTGTGVAAMFLGPAIAPFGSTPKVITIAQHPTIHDIPSLCYLGS